MTLADIETRLRRIEIARAHRAVGSRPTKVERGAIVATSLARPEGLTIALAAAAAEPNPAVHERSRAVIEAA